MPQVQGLSHKTALHSPPSFQLQIPVQVWLSHILTNWLQSGSFPSSLPPWVSDTKPQVQCTPILLTATGTINQSSTTCSLGLVRLLEQLTELSEPFLLSDHLFIIKRYNSGTARWRRCIGHDEKDCRTSLPSGTPTLPKSPQVPNWWIPWNHPYSPKPVFCEALWSFIYIGTWD